MEMLNALYAQFSQHPLAYTLGALTTIGALLQRVAPHARITRLINAAAANAPEILTIVMSFASKKQLMKALELSGHVIEDLAKAVEDEPKQVEKPVVAPVAQEPAMVAEPVIELTELPEKKDEQPMQAPVEQNTNQIPTVSGEQLVEAIKQVVESVMANKVAGAQK